MGNSDQKSEWRKNGILEGMQKQAGRGQEYVKADMQGTACPYQREGGVYLDQQIGSQSTDQQIDYILPFIARDDPEKQAYKDGNRKVNLPFAISIWNLS